MGKTPSIFDTNRLIKFLGAGFVLAILGVGVFIGMWILLGSADMADFPRLILSFCLPPALIALTIGLYMVFTRRKLDEDVG